MDKLRVVHYINQFFAGVGGEEKAGLPPQVLEGAVGPAVALQKALEEAGTVVATIYCGDNYISENPEEALKRILTYIRGFEPHVVVGGPAFGSGRYGVACGLVASTVQKELGIPGVIGMHEDNPGVELYRGKVCIASTYHNALGMAKAIPVMASLARKLALGEPLGPADEEGYIPTRKLKNQFSQTSGAQRAVDMLLKKIRGEPFKTEWPMPKYDRVAPAFPLKDLRQATIALVSESGVVPKGNPDRLEGAWATKWLKYSVQGIDDLTPDKWQSIHGGFDTTLANQDPDRLIPLDALREMERQGAFGKLHENIYVTMGNVGYISHMKKYAQEIAAELKAAGVQGVILTGTWGTGTRSGATMAKELERAGLPTALISAMVPLAQNVGANRIVRGKAIIHPTGNPALSPREEKEWRRKLLQRALAALQAEVKGPVVFDEEA